MTSEEIREIRAIRKLLKKLEWIMVVDPAYASTIPECPYCHALAREGQHKKSCSLKKLLDTRRRPEGPSVVLK